MDGQHAFSNSKRVIITTRVSGWTQEILDSLLSSFSSAFLLWMPRHLHLKQVKWDIIYSVYYYIIVSLANYTFHNFHIRFKCFLKDI